MPKPVNCCVPGCFNNFRNSTGLQYYRIPKDSRLRTEYVRLIRNKTLKLNSDNTRICSEHFEGGRKMNSDNLHSIFPWTKAKESRRQLIRKEPLQRQNLQQSEPSAMEMETTTTNINGKNHSLYLLPKEHSVLHSNHRLLIKEHKQKRLTLLTLNNTTVLFLN